jgi:hypothetical protein
MADIHIERRRKPVWPWILGLIILAGLVWAVIEYTDRDKNKVAYQESYVPEEAVRPGMPGIDQEETEGQSLGMTPGDTAASKTQAFVSFVNNNEFEQGIASDPQVTSEGLILLSDAIEEISPDYSLTVNRLRNTAEEIQNNPQSMANAENIKTALSNAAETLKDIQANEYPEMKEEVNEVEKVAKSINAKGVVENQKEKVKDFFEKAATVINEMEKEEQPS